MDTRTTTQLIQRLRNHADSEAWSGFDARYRPILIGIGRSMGFSGVDADEFAQRALAAFARAHREGQYDPARGRLRSWLIGIARNVGREMRRSAAQNMAGDARLNALEADVPDEDHLSRVWEKERQATILSLALDTLRRTPRMEAHTIRAFELFALRGVPADQVAADCGMNVDTVYVIKNRLTTRLREIVRELTTAFDEGD